MKKFVLLCISVFFVFLSCGEAPVEGPADPLKAAPDDFLYLFLIDDPALIIERIDAIANGTGIPDLPDNPLTTWLSNSIPPYGSLDEIQKEYGIDLNSKIVIFMTGMAPNTFGGAFSITDVNVFNLKLEELGLEFEDSDPVNGIEIRTITSPMGYIYFATYRDVALLAGTRTILEEMINGVDDVSADEIISSEKGTFYMSMDFTMVGPMMAQSFGQYRAMALASQYDDPGGMGKTMINAMFDFMNIFFTQTSHIEVSLIFGEDRIEYNCNAEFIEGSDLAGLCKPVEAEDLTGRIPAGDIMVARASINPETIEQMMPLIFGLFEIEVSPEIIETFALLSRNTAISWLSDDSGNPMHFIAIYEQDPSLDLTILGEATQEYTELMFGMIPESALWMSIEPMTTVEYQGRTYLHFSTSMDFDAYIEQMELPEIEMNQIPEGFEISSWITEADGFFWLEVADEPEIIAGIIENGVQGETAAEVLIYAANTRGEEFSAAINISRYLVWAMNFAPGVDQLLDFGILEEIDAWMYYGVDCFQNGFKTRGVISNDDFSGFICACVELWKEEI